MNKGKNTDRNRRGKPGRPRKKGYGSGEQGNKKWGKEAVRLNKFIAHSGICSRREADTHIQAGLVSVNGEIVTELGTQVSPHDDVRFNGERIKPERKVYLLLNKPKDYVTTTDDPHAKKTVMQLVDRACPERIYPVGRLDRNTTGVLLFTNDGEITKRLLHPKHGNKKIYHVKLDQNLNKSDMEKIVKGVAIEENKVVKADTIHYVDQDDKSQVGIELHSGENRVVRRIFEALNYKVTKLDRVYFAGLTKKNIQRGKWRFLDQKEVNMLHMQASGKK